MIRRRIIRLDLERAMVIESRLWRETDDVENPPLWLGEATHAN
jgi:hypothetical protein